MDARLEEDLRRILGAVEIRSPSVCTFAGRPCPGGAGFPVPGPVPTALPPVVATLELQLYEHCYCRRFTGELATPTLAVEADDLLAALRAANHSRDRWEDGWEIVQPFPTGQILARRHGVHRVVTPGDFITANGAGAPHAGAAAHLFCRRESLNWQPGFYFAMGQAVHDHQDDSRQVRFYWHATAACAPSLLADLTRSLNEFEIPFRCKCLTTSAMYRRSDPLVLYVNRRHYPLTASLLVETHARHASQLGEATPLFAKRLASGLALAEDPGSGESFGMRQCRLLAEGLWQAFASGMAAEDERLAAIESTFRKAGLSLDRPHLNPGSTDTYEWPPA